MKIVRSIKDIAAAAATLRELETEAAKQPTA